MENWFVYFSIFHFLRTLCLAFHIQEGALMSWTRLHTEYIRWEREESKGTANDLGRLRIRLRHSEGKSAILCSPAHAFLVWKRKQFRSTCHTAAWPLTMQNFCRMEASMCFLLAWANSWCYFVMIMSVMWFFFRRMIGCLAFLEL